MALQSSYSEADPLKFSEIKDEFGEGNTFRNYLGASEDIAESGTLKFSDFLGKSAPLELFLGLKVRSRVHMPPVGGYPVRKAWRRGVFRYDNTPSVYTTYNARGVKYENNAYLFHNSTEGDGINSNMIIFGHPDLLATWPSYSDYTTAVFAEGDDGGARPQTFTNHPDDSNGSHKTPIDILGAYSYWVQDENYGLVRFHMSWAVLDHTKLWGIKSADYQNYNDNTSSNTYAVKVDSTNMPWSKLTIESQHYSGYPKYQQIFDFSHSLSHTTSGFAGVDYSHYTGTGSPSWVSQRNVNPAVGTEHIPLRIWRQYLWHEYPFGDGDAKPATSLPVVFHLIRTYGYNGSAGSTTYPEMMFMDSQYTYKVIFEWEED